MLWVTHHWYGTKASSIGTHKYPRCFGVGEPSFVLPGHISQSELDPALCACMQRSWLSAIRFARRLVSLQVCLPHGSTAQWWVHTAQQISLKGPPAQSERESAVRVVDIQ